MADNDWKSRLNMVYSTNPDYHYEYDEEREPETLVPAKQRLRVSLDRRQRNGKQVTLISGFVGTTEDLKSLGKLLKNKCGVGGTVKNGEILIQGDCRDKVAEYLVNQGYRTVKT
jgi:translation initiation factor 1